MVLICQGRKVGFMMTIAAENFSRPGAKTEFIKQAPRLLCWLLLLLLLPLSACSENDDITKVKNTVLKEYPDRTIVQALEAAFNNPVWKNSILVDGQVQVIFEGTINEATHARAVEDYINRGGTVTDSQAVEIWPVNSQTLLIWSHSSEETEFGLSEMANEYWRRNNLPESSVMAIIYGK
jgi:hypothetical protein